jgi:hypothetical protein
MSEAKFVQITAVNAGPCTDPCAFLYALDSEGQIWEVNLSADIEEWEPMSVHPEEMERMRRKAEMDRMRRKAKADA